MHHKRIFRHLKIQIDLHAPVVCMARHCIPHAARLERRHAHHELAALDLTGKDILVDHSVIGFLQTAKLHFILVLDNHYLV